jgi:hypothetical protein
MKKVISFLIVTLLLCSLSSCVLWEEGPTVPYSEPENELYSDVYRTELWPQMRSIDLNHLVGNLSDYGRERAPRNNDLGEMKRFLFTRGGNEFENDCFFLDMRSRRIYYDRNSFLHDALMFEYVVDLTQEDIDGLLQVIEETGLQGWQNRYLGSSNYGWTVAIEYNDGTIEQHTGPLGKPWQFETLLGYVLAQATTYPQRMYEDRKTTVNIDYLVTTFRGYNQYPWEVRDITAGGVERILFFEAEGPHEIGDHSRQPQKTLLLDVLNGTLYYEPERTVYEDITKAYVVQPLGDVFTEQITNLLVEYEVSSWNVNELYLGNDITNPMHFGDIPAWSIAIQFEDGYITHYLGDGMGETGMPEGCAELFEQIWALEF